MGKMHHVVGALLRLGISVSVCLTAYGVSGAETVVDSKRTP